MVLQVLMVKVSSTHRYMQMFKEQTFQNLRDTWVRPNIVRCLEIKLLFIEWFYKFLSFIKFSSTRMFMQGTNFSKTKTYRETYMKYYLLCGNYNSHNDSDLCL